MKRPTLFPIQQDRSAPGQQIGLRYKTQLAQNLSNGSLINYNTPVYDTHGMVTIGAAWQAQLKATGIWLASAAIRLADRVWAAGEFAYLYLDVNGSIYCIMDLKDTWGGQRLQLVGSTEFFGKTGDLVKFRISHNLAAPVGIFTTNSNFSYCTLTLCR